MYDDFDMDDYATIAGTRKIMTGNRVVLKTTGSVWHCEKHCFVDEKGCWRVKLRRLDGTGKEKWLNEDEVVALHRERPEPTSVVEIAAPTPAIPAASPQKTELKLRLPTDIARALHVHCASKGITRSQFVVDAVLPLLRNS